ncbi:Major Facilitator Superfamily (MFS) [Thraustotheca clavata]|uniref:Major Facilitator Superfamily (MFS) n=1 Tax=Thraustotheca clavata TaxID=74557 RepID=A0A1W0A406_9STRA|nr:Major Facilitator Superfamily (MFS) [Thraustotheca clavata]
MPFERARKYWATAEHNVRLAFIFTISFWSCRSIIFQQVLSGYVYVLTGSNEPVGLVKGIQGVVQMIAAVPGGYACDHFRRDTVLKVSAVLGLGCIIMSLVAFGIGHLNLIYVTFGCWGLFCALQRPALEALFADSVPNGERAYPITIKYTLMNTAMVAGPLVCIIFFQWYGDTWSLPGLQTVLLVGTVIGIPPLILLFYFNDDLAYENYTVPMKNRSLSFVDEDGIVEYSFTDDDPNPKTTERTNLVPELADNEVGVERNEHGDVIGTSNTFLCFGPRHVPYILFFADFIICNGAGMTINFFPVFFQNEYNLTPSQVNFLFVAQPVVVVVLAFITERVAARTGGIETVVATRFFATLCLLFMAYMKPLWGEIGLFLLRSGFMRCSEPLRTSILMDYVPQSLRGRWNALEGLTQFTYSGSAVVGGYLIERHGYRYCFFITAIIYAIGLSFELLLVPVIRNHHAKLAQKKQSKVVALN